MPQRLKIKIQTGVLLFDSTWIATVNYEKEEFEDKNYKEDKILDYDEYFDEINKLFKHDEADTEVREPQNQIEDEEKNPPQNKENNNENDDGLLNNNDKPGEDENENQSIPLDEELNEDEVNENKNLIYWDQQIAEIQ